MKSKLKLGTPVNGSDIFERQHLNDPILSTFKHSENCYIAFDTEGNQVGPCGLNITAHYPEIKMCMKTDRDIRVTAASNHLCIYICVSACFILCMA